MESMRHAAIGRRVIRPQPAAAPPEKFLLRFVKEGQAYTLPGPPARPPVFILAPVTPRRSRVPHDQVAGTVVPTRRGRANTWKSPRPSITVYLFTFYPSRRASVRSAPGSR